MNRFARSISTLAVLAGGLAIAAARADEVYIGDLAYRPVAIVDAADGYVVFRVFSEVKLAKPVDQVTRVVLTGAPAFNRAEELAAGGRWAQAVAAYDVAGCELAEPWQKRLLQWRTLMAMDRAGRIGEAAALWLATMDENSSSPVAMSLRPACMDGADQASIARAIELLAAKGDQLAGDEVYRTAVDGLLEELKRRVQPSATQPARPDATADAAETRQQVIALMDAADRLAQPGHPADRDKLCQAGLDYMQVASLYPDSPRAAEALLKAGRINTELGNPAAASAAFEAIVRRYPSSPQAQEARRYLPPAATNETQTPGQGK